MVLSCQKTDKEIPISLKTSKNEVLSFLKKTDIKSSILIEKINSSEEGAVVISYVTYKVNGKTFNNIAFLKGKGKVLLKGSYYPVENGVVVKCAGSCSGSTSKCTITGTYDPNTGINTIECSCEGCVMEVNQQ